jgi:sortase (surface protein transpeptidase)
VTAPDPAPDTIRRQAPRNPWYPVGRPKRGAPGAGQLQGRALWAAYLGICLFGAGLLAIALSQRIHRWAPPPLPAAAASLQSRAAAPRTAELAGSAPVRVRIPSIGVTANIISVGLDAKGGVAVPPLSTPMLAGWYDRGAAPGQPGAAVLLGHVDSAATGPAVFYKLGDLLPGDLVYVTRKDNRTVVFEVTSIALYSESDFPASQVYGPTPNPTLRLVTCGGGFDSRTHHYVDRTIAFASYIGQLR